MKKTLILFFLLSANISFSQITIDSFAVYNTGQILDSFYFKATSQGQTFLGFDLPSFLDICSTIFGRAVYKGCETGTATTIDTMYVYGYPSKKMTLATYWDTSYTCALPLQGTETDFVVWNQCDNFGIAEEFLQEQLTVYPNPTKDLLYLENLNKLRFESISLYDQFGRKIEEYGKEEEIFDLSHLVGSIFYLHLTSDDGKLVKKIVRSN